MLQSGTVLLQSGTATWCYKVGQGLLQSGTAFFITKWDNFITKWDGYYKVGRFYYKAGRVLQSGTVITKWALTFIPDILRETIPRKQFLNAGYLFSS